MPLLVTIFISPDPIQALPPTFPSDGKSGAVLDFYGVVRKFQDETSLTGLNYEAYEEMAHRQFRQIIDSLQSQHPINEIHLIHRIGFVPVGEPSLFIRIQSTHRQEGLVFMDKLISQMKQDVPIWKQDQPA